jgi:N-methylhydantoinase A
MSRIIGIDVGGTNTNAVLLEDGNLVATTKYPTDHRDLLSSTKTVLEEIISATPRPEQGDLSLHLSTTLTTNAVVEGRGESAAAILAPGPGVALADLEFPFPTYPVEGAIDHRGRETSPLDMDQVRQVMRDVRQSGTSALAIVGKFSVRNPGHELLMEEMIYKEFSEFSPVTLGHRLSGRLNFPRRITTALLNASISRIQADFAAVVENFSGRYCFGDRIFLLKADGGTMRLAESLIRPIETVLSGPAASIMAALALSPSDGRTIVTLDIGGTTTEISVMVGGEPLEERDGATIAGYHTLVPALFSRSIGLGGDSSIHWIEGKLQIGPGREGPPIVLGGPQLTPTDAVIALGGAFLGDRRAQAQAWGELECFGKQAGLEPAETAKRIITAFCDKAVAEIRSIFDYLNQIPVYTVSEVLTPHDLKPEKLVGMGGPAEFFIPKIAAAMGLDYQVLPCAEAANAVGAAASRPTVAINLRADTAIGKLVVPELDQMEDIRRAMIFDVKRAREIVRERITAYAAQAGTYPEQPEIEITDEEVFNVVRGFYTAGRIFSLKAQVKPKVTRVRVS